MDTIPSHPSYLNVLILMILNETLRFSCGYENFLDIQLISGLCDTRRTWHHMISHRLSPPDSCPPPACRHPAREDIIISTNNG